MHHFVRSCLLVMSLATAVPLINQEDVLAGGQNCCCQSCRQPCGRCSCGAPQTAYQPVVETQYAQQPVWQTRDVVETAYRNEQTLETVPATVMENVTVDEGGYQQVWVPRLTTRQVARTVYQTRTACRTVPYQVTRRVAECTTQTVPYQTVRYVPTNGTAIGCAPHHHHHHGHASATLPPPYSGSATAYGSYPTLASSPNYPTPVIGTSIYPSDRRPEGRFADAPVTPIRPRYASRWNDNDSSYRMAERDLPFVPAPSAAQVWRSTAVR